MKTLTNKKGFTLIEVVLVLAIGGLIFLLAFIAFQQVSANRRDTQRRSDAGRILAELQNYGGDTKGVALTGNVTGGTSSPNTGICSPTNPPNTAAPFTTLYLCKDGLFLSPGGTNYNTVQNNTSTVLVKDEIRISMDFGAWAFHILGCNGNAVPDGTIKVEVGLEKGTACRDSL